MPIYTNVERLFSKPSWTVLPLLTVYDGNACSQHIHLIFLLASIGYIYEEGFYHLELYL